MARQDAYEWLDGNMHRNYPIADSCMCMADSGVILPSSFLVDIDISVVGLPEEDAAERFFISSVAVADGYATVSLSYKSASSGTVLCARTLAIPTTLTNADTIAARTIQLLPVSDVPESLSALSGLGGSFIVGTCQDIANIGTLTFDYDQTTILSIRIHSATTEGLHHVTVHDSVTDEDVTLYNNFSIQAGDGVSISVGNASDGSDLVTINRCPTDEELEYGIYTYDGLLSAIYEALGKPVRSINGVKPNSSGNLTIAGGDCVQIASDRSSELIIKNTCSKPCCTTESTNDIEAGLATLEQECTRLKSYYESLSSLVNAMQARLAVLIVSKQ